MTTIDPRLGDSGALQARLAALRRPAGAGAPAASGSAPAASSTATSGSTLLHGIRTIAADDPDRRRKAVRLFLQAELLREFGDGLITDPQFGTMIDTVLQQMQQDPQTAAAAYALADLLIERARG